MRTCSSYLESTLYILLSFNVSKVKVKVVLMGIELTSCIHDSRCQGLLSIEKTYHLHDVVDPIHVEVIDYSGLTGILSGEDKSFITQLTGFDGDWQCTSNGHKVAIKSQFTHNEIAR